jgi:3-dehydroquinate synthase
LIAQVDSSIGGKTGVNLPSGKNLVGTFYQPAYVHIDVELLKTLDGREYRSGQAEVIKHAVIKGEEFLSYMEKNIESILQKEKESLEYIIAESVKLKGSVVEQDEREAGLRRILNLGHTIGHGLEATMGYGYMRHGEGISLGMIAASEIAVIMGKGSQEFTKRLIKILKNFVLPVTMPPGVSVQKVMDTIYLDKKVRNSNIEFVLPLEPGDIVPGIAVDEDTVIGVMEDLSEKNN